MANQEHYFRLLGVRDGLSHARISVGNLKGRLRGPGGCYLPPARHVRKRAAVQARIDELDLADASIGRQLDEVREALSKLDQPS